MNNIIKILLYRHRLVWNTALNVVIYFTRPFHKGIGMSDIAKKIELIKISDKWIKSDAILN